MNFVAKTLHILGFGRADIFMARRAGLAYNVCLAVSCIGGCVVGLEIDLGRLEISMLDPYKRNGTERYVALDLISRAMEYYTSEGGDTVTIIRQLWLSKADASDEQYNKDYANYAN